MKAMTKLFALGAVGAGAYATVRALMHARAKHQQQEIDAFDYGDLDAPVVVAEEVVVVTEAGPYEIEMELVPSEELGESQGAGQNEAAQPQSSQQQTAGDGSSFDIPGRGAPPR